MSSVEQQPAQDGTALGAGAVPPTGPPQLPPQMFTTAAQLLDLTDSRYSCRLSCKQVFQKRTELNS